LGVEDIVKGYAELIVQVNTIIAAIMHDLKQNNKKPLKLYSTSSMP